MRIVGSRLGQKSRQRWPMILLNGLAEQTQSWFANVPVWRCAFDVHQPILVEYDSSSLHERISRSQAVTVGFLVERLELYLDRFDPGRACDLVANSLGAKVAIEFAARHPKRVRRLVLLAPSGFSARERLPIGRSMRSLGSEELVRSVFHDPRFARQSLIEHYDHQLKNRDWRIGLIHTIRGTSGPVGTCLSRIKHRTLMVIGANDRIIDPAGTIRSARLLPRGHVVVLDRCGHAPQIERSARINMLVTRFLKPLPATMPAEKVP